MSLYHVQDSDMPMYVITDNFEGAIMKWKRKVLLENPTFIFDEIEEPEGVHFIANSDEVLT